MRKVWPNDDRWCELLAYSVLLQFHSEEVSTLQTCCCLPNLKHKTHEVKFSIKYTTLVWRTRARPNYTTQILWGVGVGLLLLVTILSCSCLLSVAWLCCEGQSQQLSSVHLYTIITKFCIHSVLVYA